MSATSDKLMDHGHMDKLNGGQSRGGGQAISIRKYADEGQRKHGNGSNATLEPGLKAKYPNALYGCHEKSIQKLQCRMSIRWFLRNPHGLVKTPDARKGNQ